MRKLIGLVAGAFAFSGCGGGDEADVNVLDVRGDEYAFVMSEQIQPGWTTIDFTNTGAEPHEFALFRLDEGKTIDDVRELLSDPDAQQQGPPEWVTILAGVPTLAAGAESSLTQELEPGRHVLVCFLEGPSGRPHFADGMIRELVVAGEASGDEPDADAELALGEGLEAPEVEAGERTLRFRNDGKEPSSLFLVAYEPGETAEDLERWEAAGAKGPAPAEFLGGAIDVPAKSSVYYTIDLEEGREYTLLDDQRGRELSFTPS
jgi:plastocyanin